MKTARFVVYKDKKGQWRWRLVAANGRVLAQGEGHSRKTSALRSVEAVKKAIFSMETPRISIKNPDMDKLIGSFTKYLPRLVMSP